MTSTHEAVQSNPNIIGAGGGIFLGDKFQPYVVRGTNIRVMDTETGTVDLAWPAGYPADSGQSDAAERLESNLDRRLRSLEEQVSALTSSVKRVQTLHEEASEEGAFLEALKQFSSAMRWSERTSFVERSLRIAGFGFEWNGPGTGPIEPSSLTAGVRAALEVFKRTGAPPFIAAGDDGSIVLEWDGTNEQEYELHISGAAGHALSAVLLDGDVELDVKSVTDLGRSLDELDLAAIR